MSQSCAVILIAIAVAVALYLFLLLPSFSKREACRRFAARPYAHRGLHDKKRGIPENSLAAFAAAVSAGYAIELDVHRTRDGRMVVFHDESLQRMCGVDGTIEGSDLADLQKLRLAGTDERIPLFDEVLALVDGKVPLLVELKLPTFDTSLCEMVAQRLDAYPGEYMIESFHPMGLLWFRRHRPNVLRGQLSAKFPHTLPTPALFKFCTTALLVNVLGRPDFIAYGFRTAGRPGVWLHRHFFRTPLFAWTVRSEDDAAACADTFDAIIFERFTPGDPAGMEHQTGPGPGNA